MNETPNSNNKGIEKYFFRASANEFKLVPEYPIAYWLPNSARQAFSTGDLLDHVAPCRAGMQTGENEKFVRLWFEVSFATFGQSGCSKSEAEKSGKKWFPYNSGGAFRKWYGNNEKVVDWYLDGLNIKQDKLEKFSKGLCLPSNSKPKNEQFYFLESITWTAISSSFFGVRISNSGHLFDIAGASTFPSKDDFQLVAGFLIGKIATYFLTALNPTLNVQPGNIGSLPFDSARLIHHKEIIQTIVENGFSLAKLDWDFYETSWNFTTPPLLLSGYHQATLKGSYQKLRDCWREMTLEMQRLEEENNRIFIEAYGLQDELTPDVPLKEITLTCNPHYRYGGEKTEDELEALLLADTMRELVSYAVGCMFGRYSLDKEGLILANQGETLAEYQQQVPEPRFMPDDDNVIPLLDGDWFADDITLRFRQFLRVAFGDVHYEDNLAFIEQALNVKGKRNYSLRDYFLGEFYTDHVKRYKKRPIYWLFSSPKGSFNALIYLHRYRSDTVSVVLKYLRDYRDKLIDERKHNMAIVGKDDKSQGEKIRAQKEIERLSKVLAELEDYEREVLYPLATEQKAIDLDDGVKVNYLKFGGALKKIVGLDSKSED